MRETRSILLRATPTPRVPESELAPQQSADTARAAGARPVGDPIKVAGARARHRATGRDAEPARVSPAGALGRNVRRTGAWSIPLPASCFERTEHGARGWGRSHAHRALAISGRAVERARCPTGAPRLTKSHTGKWLGHDQVSPMRTEQGNGRSQERDMRDTPLRVIITEDAPAYGVLAC